MNVEWISAVAALGSAIAAFLSWRSSVAAAASARAANVIAQLARVHSLRVDILIAATQIKVQSERGARVLDESVVILNTHAALAHQFNSSQYLQMLGEINSQKPNFEVGMQLAKRMLAEGASLNSSIEQLESQLVEVKVMATTIDEHVRAVIEARDSLEKQLIAIAPRK